MTKKLFVIFLASLMLAGAVGAQVLTGTSFKIHQNLNTPVNDLHFRVYPNEPWVYILGWNIKVTPTPTLPISVTPVPDSTGQIHWLDVTVKWPTVLPYCKWVTVSVNLKLTTWNAINIDKVYWTYNGNPVGKGSPGRGFSVDFIRLSALTAETGLTTYWLHNPSESILNIKDFKFAKNQPEYIDPAEVLDFQGWTDFIGDFTIGPGESYAIPVEGAELGKFLFARYALYENGNSYNADIYVGPVADVHQDQDDPSLKIGIEEQGLLDEVKFLNVAAYPGYTEIRYQLPKASVVSLVVYSLTGERVATLVEELQAAGGHTFVWKPQNLPAGLYICKLSADGIQASEKMVRLN